MTSTIDTNMLTNKENSNNPNNIEDRKDSTKNININEGK